MKARWFAARFSGGQVSLRGAFERPYNIQMEPTPLTRWRVPAGAAHLDR